MKPEQVKKELLKMPMIKLTSLNDALYIHGINKNVYEVLTNARLRYLEQKYSAHFFFYKQESTLDRNGHPDISTLRKPFGQKYERQFHFLIESDLPETRNGIIENFTMLFDSRLLPKIYTCDKLKNCRFQTDRRDNFERHVEKCGTFNVQKTVCVQTVYGNQVNILREIADAGFIPMEAIDYKNFTMATFDIETIEARYSKAAPKLGLVEEAELRLLSIACGSNISGYKPKCWIRKNLEPEHERIIIRKFVDELEFIHCEKTKNLPEWISNGINAIDDKLYELKDAKNWKKKELRKFKRTLENLTKLDIFGFNSSKSWDQKIIHFLKICFCNLKSHQSLIYPQL